MKHILTVTLNPALNKTITLGSWKTGGIFRVKDLGISAGGKGINVSRALKSLKAPCLSFIVSGAFTGQWLRQLLGEENHPFKSVEIEQPVRINTTIISPNQKTTRILEEGPQWSRLDEKRVFIQFGKLLKNALCVVLSGRQPNGVSETIYVKWVQAAKGRHVPVLLDTSGPALRFGIKAKPDFIKPNLGEAQSIFQKKLNSLASLKSALYYFYRLGISHP